MKTIALCILIPLSILAALVIEVCFLTYELLSAIVGVCITGKERGL